MSRKLQLDSAIAADIQTVNADSYIDSLKMIDIDDIEPNRNNFYEISEIESLADDIERQRSRIFSGRKTLPLTLFLKLTMKKKQHLPNRLSFSPMRNPKRFQNTSRIFSFWQRARISRCCANLRTGCDFENVLFIAR